MAQQYPYEQRVLRHVLESCDWLASRGREGLPKLRAMTAQTEASDGGAGHPLVTLPAGWPRGIPLHGAAMNGHVHTTLAYCVDELGCCVDGVEPRGGNSPCHTAVIWGHLDVVCYLLARGARHDAENADGLALAALARRRQRRLLSGAPADRAYLERRGPRPGAARGRGGRGGLARASASAGPRAGHGVPLEELRREGERLVAILDGVEAAGSWDAWAAPRFARPAVVRAAPWLVAAARRRDLAVVRASCDRRGGGVPAPAARPRPRGGGAARRREAAAAAAAAAAEARAAVRAADPPLAAALGDAGLGGDHFARALRWLGAETVDDARGLDRGDVARVDGLSSADRRRLWLFVAAAAAAKEAAADAAEAAARERFAAPPPAPALDPKAALLFRARLPLGVFACAARFAYNARRPPPRPAPPVDDAAVLAAIRIMKI